ncbi:MAG: hypothetical protein IIC84_07620, partial [Chloroflexi bacterium]|nr:hypothetical protein [Chloroflexota bacterium]
MLRWLHHFLFDDGCENAKGLTDMDLIVINGRIETMDSEGTVVQAVGVRDGKIAALGDNQ